MNYHKKANITLTVVFLLFVGAAVLEYFNPNIFGIRLIYFVLEAALVGGIADWFAVTAIFKKPLGWGYHTALIPRNREKVIEAVASMVQKELLHIDVIRKKIEGIPFSEALLRYVEKEGGSAFLTDKLSDFIRCYAEKQDPSKLAERLSEFLRDRAKDWNLAPRVQVVSGWALEHGYIDQGLNLVVEGLWEKAAGEETRKVFVYYLEEIKEEKILSGGALFRTLIGMVEKSDALNLDEAAEALQVELLLTLRKIKDPRHPLRVALKDTLTDKLAELEQDTEFKAQIEQWKDDVLTEELLEKFLETVLRVVINIAAAPSNPSEPNALQRALQPCVENYWISIQGNKALQETFDLFVADTLCRVIKNEHDMIGVMVRETLGAYTDQDLNQFIEEKAGNDLQWIRINGSIIGGVVGLILFLFLEFVYDPILPSLMNVFR